MNNNYTKFKKNWNIKEVKALSALGVNERIICSKCTSLLFGFGNNCEGASEALIEHDAVDVRVVLLHDVLKGSGKRWSATSYKVTSASAFGARPEQRPTAARAQAGSRKMPAFPTGPNHSHCLGQERKMNK